MGMKKMITSVKWRQLLVSGASLGMLLLAAGAKWRP
jgi:hypothetical protein